MAEVEGISIEPRKFLKWLISIVVMGAFLFLANLGVSRLQHVSDLDAQLGALKIQTEERNAQYARDRAEMLNRLKEISDKQDTMLMWITSIPNAPKGKRND